MNYLSDCVSLISQISLFFFFQKFAYISFETVSIIAENKKIWELLSDQPAVNLVFWLLIGNGGHPP